MASAAAPGLPAGLSVGKYAALFAREAGEQLRTADRHLAALEGAAGAGDGASGGSVDALFRCVHTIKGMAAAMGYAAVERAAHATEDRLAALRGRDDAEVRSALGELVAGVDAIHRAVQGLASPAVDDVASTSADLTTRGADGTAAAGASAAGSEPTPPVSAERTVRVAADTLDRLQDLAAELSAARDRLHRASAHSADPQVARAAAEIARSCAAIADEVRAARLVPLGELFAGLPRVVREAARACGKRAELATAGGELLADRGVTDALLEPLVHLLRNAVDHGVEVPNARAAAGKTVVGKIAVRASRDGPTLVVRVSDDGAGVDRAAVVARAHARGWRGARSDDADAALLAMLAMPGLSTAAEGGRTSGRGVGVDAALARVRALGGALAVATGPGEGTTFTLHLPTSWSVATCLVVRDGGVHYALPVAHVSATHDPEGAGVRAPHLATWLGDEVGRCDDGRAADDCVELAVDGGADGVRATLVAVDETLGVRECVIKPLAAAGALGGAFRIALGATILDGGEVALVLDVPHAIGRRAAVPQSATGDLPCPSPPA